MEINQSLCSQQQQQPLGVYHTTNDMATCHPHLNESSCNYHDQGMMLSPTLSSTPPVLRIDKDQKSKTHHERLQSLSPSTPVVPIPSSHCNYLQDELNGNSSLVHSSNCTFNYMTNTDPCFQSISVTTNHCMEMALPAPQFMSFDDFLKVNSNRYSFQNDLALEDNLQKRKRQSNKEDRQEEKEHHQTKMTKSGFSTSSFCFFH